MQQASFENSTHIENEKERYHSILVGISEGNVDLFGWTISAVISMGWLADIGGDCYSKYHIVRLP
jgi:hypothetical protein